MILMMLLMLLAGTGMFFVGARGLMARRVTMYSGKWLLALVAICFLPQFINGMQLISSLPSLAMLNIGMYVFLLLVFWFVTKGHICFGVSEDSANAALKNAFERMGLKYEQLLGSVRLEDGAVFNVSLQSWLGTMQIKPKNREAEARMKALMSGLSGYFSASGDKPTYVAYWLYAISGSFLIATMLVFVGLAARLPQRTIRTAPQNAAPVRTAQLRRS